MVKGLTFNKVANETMAETVTEVLNNKVIDMVADIDIINNQLKGVKFKSYSCSILLGSCIGLCAFEVVRLVVSLI